MNNQRWQADAAPMWRKLVSRNWWWYGEINPDSSTLPPETNRPQFWRSDFRTFMLALACVPVIIFLTSELNSRYWVFNKNRLIVGSIIKLQYNEPQLSIELEDKSQLALTFPHIDMLGFSRYKNRAVEDWMNSVDLVAKTAYVCPNRKLFFQIDEWKFTFDNTVRVWEVRCAEYDYTLLSQTRVNNVFREILVRNWFISLFILFGFFIFFSILIFKRERDRYVKQN